VALKLKSKAKDGGMTVRTPYKRKKALIYKTLFFQLAVREGFEPSIGY